MNIEKMVSQQNNSKLFKLADGLNNNHIDIPKGKADKNMNG